MYSKISKIENGLMFPRSMLLQSEKSVDINFLISFSVGTGIGKRPIAISTSDKPMLHISDCIT